jgi:16S rRNA (cytidine1402-2'-O)-methyltransferase
MSGRLLVCATPIGNLEDVTHRLLRVLGEVDLVAAEDTRRTRKLLTRYGIKSRVVSYHVANETRETRLLVSKMRGGQAVALVTDSGTPTISDPGYELVRQCIDAGIPVEVVPGPSAVIAALAVSGLPTDRFAFEGFLPRRVGGLRRKFEEIASDPRTLVFFETPNRLPTSLAVALEVLGDRRMALARELTKAHEEVRRGKISEVLETLADPAVRGEVVLVIEGHHVVGDIAGAVTDARQLVASGLPKSRAAAQAANRWGVTRAEVYESLKNYSGENGSQD